MTVELATACGAEKLRNTFIDRASNTTVDLEDTYEFTVSQLDAYYEARRSTDERNKNHVKEAMKPFDEHLSFLQASRRKQTEGYYVIPKGIDD